MQSNSSAAASFPAPPATAYSTTWGAPENDRQQPTANPTTDADQARQQRPDLLVLFTTGYARNAIVHGGVLDPGTHLLPKPFTYTALAAKMRAVLDG
jgi:hypothetical protein